MKIGRFPKEGEYDITYQGWAPCVHSDDAVARVKKWLEEEVLAPLSADFDPGAFETFPYGGTIEMLIWSINLLGGTPSMQSDLWVAVWTIGSIGKTTIHTDIQADTILLALAETYRWWRAKHHELTDARKGGHEPSSS